MWRQSIWRGHARHACGQGSSDALAVCDRGLMADAGVDWNAAFRCVDRGPPRVNAWASKQRNSRTRDGSRSVVGGVSTPTLSAQVAGNFHRRVAKSVGVETPPTSAGAFVQPLDHNAALPVIPTLHAIPQRITATFPSAIACR
ncbi:DUF6053 domain-containing protein [Lysobacter capsici]|uniref:DUF6053 domain-containing protein n=1 Tax=Lysobacter capsici TaxID=435897 RepID=UPI003D2F8DD3